MNLKRLRWNCSKHKKWICVLINVWADPTLETSGNCCIELIHSYFPSYRATKALPANSSELGTVYLNEWQLWVPHQCCMGERGGEMKTNLIEPSGLWDWHAVGFCAALAGWPAGCGALRASLKWCPTDSKRKEKQQQQKTNHSGGFALCVNN